MARKDKLNPDTPILPIYSLEEIRNADPTFSPFSSGKYNLKVDEEGNWIIQPTDKDGIPFIVLPSKQGNK